ncbi:MAG TPA: hypothetical protein PL124_10350 [Candidatus Cloacimonadota bacterium]|nr:hypothetical protein [Candidatus Cloacimonadota bacterium]HPS39802.1 hypothetical protein [Candidatus Cloacimonadota bacterium]
MEQYPNYNQPPQQQPSMHSGYGAPIMTVGNWVVTILLMCIPLVNLIMLIVWASSSSENPNRKNWAIAYLIFMAIGIVFWIIAWGAIAGMITGVVNSMN